MEEHPSVVSDQLRSAERRLAICVQALNDILESANSEADTVDGPNGEALPNDWMKIAAFIEYTKLKAGV